MSTHSARTGQFGLLSLVAANVLGALTCLLGTSNTVPPADAGWSLDARPGTPLIIVLTFTTVGLGALGVCVALQALRRGWRPSPRLLLGLGLGFAALFALVPIGGSNDVQSYAVYGRMGVLGLDPYTTVPRELVAAHDQVARFGPDTWLDTPSVYGPVANWLFTLAAHLGGASMFRITLILKVVAAAAFALVALVLDRLAGPSPDRRARAHLLWTLNPLLLWACVAGAHVDVIAAAFMILAFAAVTRSGLPAPLVAGLSAGALIGVAASVKAPFALAGLGLAWAARGSWQTLAGLAAGVTAVVAAAYALAGQSAVDVLLNKAEDVAPTNPWRWLPRWGLDLTHPQMAQAGFAAAAVIALIMLWRLPATTLLPTGPDRPELAACVAFAACAGLLMASPQQHPWYDAMIFPLLALLPFTRIDELVQLRLLAGSLGYLPGVPLLTGVRWPEPMHWVRNEFNNWWMSAALGLLMIAIVLVLLFRRPAPARAGASPHTTG